MSDYKTCGSLNIRNVVFKNIIPPIKRFLKPCHSQRIPNTPSKFPFLRKTFTNYIGPDTNEIKRYLKSFLYARREPLRWHGHKNSLLNAGVSKSVSYNYISVRRNKQRIDYPN